MKLDQLAQQRCGWFGEGRGQCLLPDGHQQIEHSCEHDGRLLAELRKAQAEEIPPFLAAEIIDIATFCPLSAGTRTKLLKLIEPKNPALDLSEGD